MEGPLVAQRHQEGVEMLNVFDFEVREPACAPFHDLVQTEIGSGGMNDRHQRVAAAMNDDRRSAPEIASQPHLVDAGPYRVGPGTRAAPETPRPFAPRKA